MTYQQMEEGYKVFSTIRNYKKRMKYIEDVAVNIAKGVVEEACFDMQDESHRQRVQEIVETYTVLMRDDLRKFFTERIGVLELELNDIK